MQEVIKVSIGNLAFTLEKEAHRLLSEYLEHLSLHYSGKDNGEEIVASIEERIAELLCERGCRERIVETAVIAEIITLLGQPEEMDGGEDPVPEKNRKKAGRRHLYRDVDHKYVAGVCSGLSNYFSVDVAWFRILFLVLGILSVFGTRWICDLSPMFILLVYAVLWIAMPAAVTMEQKCEMTGESNSVAGIQKKVERDGSARIRQRKNCHSSDFWTGMGKIFRIVLGSLLILLGVFGSLAVIFGIFFSFSIFMPDFFSGLLSSVLDMKSWEVTVFKVTALLVLLIPNIGMLYGGIMLIFGLHAPKWKPGLVLFILWVISLVAMLSMGISSGLRTFDTTHNQLEKNIVIQDTVYVEFENCQLYRNDRVSVDASCYGYDLFFFRKEEDRSLFVWYPEFNLYRSDDAGNTASLITSTEMLSRMSIGEMDVARENPFCSFDGKVLKIKPQLLGRDCEVNDLFREVTLRVGEEVKVIVRDPVYHQFDSSFDYNNLEGLFWKIIAD